MPPLHREFKSDAVMSDGIMLHLDIFEYAKGAPTVVFIPGTAIYAMCYVELLHKIGQAGYNVVGFDPRGHGRSEGTRGSYTIEELMRDTQNVITYAIEHFNDSVSIFGSSQGGIVAFYLAAIEDRVSSAICQNIADLTHPDTYRLTRYPTLAKAIKPVLRSFSKYFPETDIPIAAYLDLEKEKVRYFGNAKRFLEMDPLTLKSVKLRALESLANTPIPAPLEDIKTPLMVLHGSHDLIFPVSYTETLFEKLNCKKRLQIYPRLHHAMLTENVDEVLPPILEWLDEIHA